MSSWTFAKLVAVPVVAGLFMACGSNPGEAPPSYGPADSGSGVTVDSSGGSSTADTGSAGDDASTGDDGNTGDDGSGSGSGSGSGGGGSCTSCTSDSDCANSCPPVTGGGTNCCDTGSGVCYATTQSSCPAPSDGGTE